MDDLEITTQRRAILEHLREYGSITSKEAFELYGATRLSAIIFDFRRRKLNIVTEMCETTNRYGNKVRYAKYIYTQEELTL